MDTRLVTIGNTSELLGVSIATLRRWDKSGKLSSFRATAGGNRYYRREDIELFLQQTQRAIDITGKNWALNETPAIPPSDYYCQTRDVFDARLLRLQNDLEKMAGRENNLSIIVSVAGEIGNNSFDHNLGVWPDIAGIFFGYDLMKRKVALADRGQGILETLRRVRPTLKNDEEALKVAFTEIVSGRAPEVRGNGLKYVKKVIAENSMSLRFQSGNAELFLEKGSDYLCLKTTSSRFHGCLAIINF